MRADCADTAIQCGLFHRIILFWGGAYFFPSTIRIKQIATGGTINVLLANLFLWRKEEVGKACPIVRRLGVEETGPVFVLHLWRASPLDGFVCPVLA